MRGVTKGNDEAISMVIVRLEIAASATALPPRMTERIAQSRTRRSSAFLEAVTR